MTEKKQKSVKEPMSAETKMLLVAMARALAMAPPDVLAITVLGLMDRVLFAKSEAGESLTNEEQLQVGKASLEAVRQALQDRDEMVGDDKPQEQGEIATKSIVEAIKAAKEANATKEETVAEALPPGVTGFIVPGNNSVN